MPRKKKTQDPKDIQWEKQLALDLVEGRAFSDWQCRNPQEVRMTFMILTLMSSKEIRQFRREKPGMVYEYLDKALPRSANGMPVFFSCHFLTQSQTKRVARYAAEIQGQRKEYLEG